MKAWLKRKWYSFLGYSDCPKCGRQTIKWEKDWIYHPEEPPMFGHWQCYNTNCLVASDIESTPWADEVAREFGHDTFKEAMYDKIRKLQ